MVSPVMRRQVEIGAEHVVEHIRRFAQGKLDLMIVGLKALAFLWRQGLGHIGQEAHVFWLALVSHCKLIHENFKRTGIFPQGLHDLGQLTLRLLLPLEELLIIGFVLRHTLR